eukprot:gnl/MRDRNA2_/MRDRNA2_225222_c0_seq1.p1 gnl/MRDRNA2_/MRDRNA2_225222_c0~~gnl/MRDRNA2_/MRDRNA2_225222_c0_seq1.p1  ORF type:complete len:241 (+),score=72.69 gnl/MRDRNA2_/MRDRNA2_225222_c0_seq1:213-935(+)
MQQPACKVSHEIPMETNLQPMQRLTEDEHQRESDRRFHEMLDKINATVQSILAEREEQQKKTQQDHQATIEEFLSHVAPVPRQPDMYELDTGEDTDLVQLYENCDWHEPDTLSNANAETSRESLSLSQQVDSEVETDASLSLQQVEPLACSTNAPTSQCMQGVEQAGNHDGISQGFGDDGEQGHPSMQTPFKTESRNWADITELEFAAVSGGHPSEKTHDKAKQQRKKKKKHKWLQAKED